MIRKHIGKKQLEYNLKHGAVKQLEFNLYILDKLEEIEQRLSKLETKKEGAESMNA